MFYTWRHTWRQVETLAKRKVGAEKMLKEFPAKQRYRSKFQRLFNSPFVHRGTNCTWGWNFADIFISDSVKIMRFLTLLWHLFLEHWFNFYAHVL